MQTITKNTLLNYISNNFITEYIINPARIYEINNKPIQNGIILYLCEREVRAKDNFALQFAFQKSKQLNLPLKIIHPRIIYDYKPKQEFIDRQNKQAKNCFNNLNLDFKIITQTPAKIIKDLKPALIIIDFNPILKRDYLKDLSCKIYEIKHSTEIHPKQTQHLTDEKKCADTEFRYGTIKGKYVIYRGENKTVGDINYLNVEEYLCALKPSYNG